MIPIHPGQDPDAGSGSGKKQMHLLGYLSPKKGVDLQPGGRSSASMISGLPTTLPGIDRSFLLPDLLLQSFQPGFDLFQVFAAGYIQPLQRIGYDFIDLFSQSLEPLAKV
jgi:hypothetical protein